MRPIFRLLILLLLTTAAALTAGRASAASTSRSGRVFDGAKEKIVKIYGAGGYRQMEAYQSGMLVSPLGHILTVFSYVLDTEFITVTLDDGRSFDAKLLGADPKLEIAVLKIDADDLPHFKLAAAVEVEAGTRVLALSNVFGVAAGDEPASVQHGIVSVLTNLAARRGAFETPYNGPVYVLDAMTNNPGAAGGALVTRRGELVAMLGKELRNSSNNTWLNYAVPIDHLRTSVEQIRAGKFVPGSAADQSDSKPQRPLELEMLGIVLMPDVLQRTPPYVDRVRDGSAAAEAGVRPDDLVILVGQRLIQTCKAIRGELEYVDYEDPVRLTVLREGQLVELVLQASVEDKQDSP